jgi:hypothetical protein
MIWFAVENNQLTGHLPREYSAWMNIRKFAADGNNFESPDIPVVWSDCWSHITNNIIAFDGAQATVAELTPVTCKWNVAGCVPPDQCTHGNIAAFARDLGIDPEKEGLEGVTDLCSKCSEISHSQTCDLTAVGDGVITPRRAAHCNGTREELLINKLNTINDTCSRMRDSFLDENGNVEIGRRMLEGSDECSKEDGKKKRCELYYKRKVTSYDVEVGICEFHFPADDPTDELRGTCVQRPFTHCMSEVITVMMEEHGDIEDSCHSMILEARRSIDGVLAEIKDLTAEKVELEQNISDADQELEAQLQKQNETLLAKVQNYSVCNATAESRRDTDLRALWEELQELEMIARPQHTSASLVAGVRVNRSDISDQIHQQAEAIRSNARSEWDAMGHQERVDAAAEYASDPGYRDFGSLLTDKHDPPAGWPESSLIEGRAMTEAEAQQTAFMQLEAEAHAKASAGAYMMSKAAMHMKEGHFLRHISMMNLSLDARACAIMGSVLERVESRFQLGIQSSPAACNASRQQLQREFTQAYLLIAGLYDNTSLQIQEEFTKCTDEVHQEYVLQMKDTIRELLEITERVHRVEHAIAIIQPRLDDLQHAQVIGERYISDTNVSCERSAEGTFYVKEVEKLIEQLSGCPGKNDFIIPLPPFVNVKGWWHNLTVTSRHEVGTSKAWRRDIIDEYCPIVYMVVRDDGNAIHEQEQWIDISGNDALLLTEASRWIAPAELSFAANGKIKKNGNVIYNYIDDMPNLAKYLQNWQQAEELNKPGEKFIFKVSSVGHPLTNWRDDVDVSALRGFRLDETHIVVAPKIDRYCPDAIAGAIANAGEGANGKPPPKDVHVQDYDVLVDGLAPKEKGYVPTFAPWGTRFGMYNSFWQNTRAQHVGSHNDFDGEVGYRFRATMSFKISALSRGVQGPSQVLADVARVSLWDDSDPHTPLVSIEVGPQSGMISDKNGDVVYAYEELPQHFQVVKDKTYRITLKCESGMPDKFYSGEPVDDIGNAYANPNEAVTTHYAVLGNGIFREAGTTLWKEGSLLPALPGNPPTINEDNPVEGGNAGIVNFFVEYGGSGYRPNLGPEAETSDRW